MTTLTIRELRQRWPAAEKALATEEEIVITRDGAPVAKLVKIDEVKAPRDRFDPERHLAEMKKILGGKVLPSVDERIRERRADRR